MKRVLITAGAVYGPLDANKLVGNRVRGIWAVAFARYLLERGHQVTLLVADIMDKMAVINLQCDFPKGLSVETHKGFWDYQTRCIALAPQHDAAVMAAAVVNWIPAKPFEGKMPTKGFNEGDVIQIPFILAPHVIDQMKVINPKLTLIGCKMLVNASEDELQEAAYGVLLKAKCNAVIANDMGKGLKRKLVVNQDRSVQVYDDDFDGFYANLLGHIEDEHYHSALHDKVYLTDPPQEEARTLFDRAVNKYRDRFMAAGHGRVFGSLAVPFWVYDHTAWLCSPREKGAMFSSQDATVVDGVDLREHEVITCGGRRATLNAPLLVRVTQKYPQARAILHLHEQFPGVPTVPYAPPGTVRDNEREIPGPVFNIEGHGFVACLDENMEIMK